MKRFYRTVSVDLADDGFGVSLDGKPVKTPRRATLALPTRALAEAVAREWRAQTTVVDPATMPLTKLANTAVDGVIRRRAEVVDQIVAFAHHDHLCYRAEGPAELVRRQSLAWDPLLDWAAERYGARLATAIGITPIAQPSRAIAALGRAVESRTAYELAALHVAASICGSLVLALALADGRLGAADAFVLSQLDERFQAEKWGLDPQAESRTRRLAEELAAADRLLGLLQHLPLPHEGRGEGG